MIEVLKEENAELIIIHKNALIFLIRSLSSDSHWLFISLLQCFFFFVLFVVWRAHSHTCARNDAISPIKMQWQKVQ